jgi:exopolysaccharide production protein ExoQ
LTPLSLFIGLLVFLCFLYIEIAKPSVGIPRLRQQGCDFFAAFLFIGDLARFNLLNTTRSDALAILAGDFTIGNISSIVWTATITLYLIYILLTGRFRVEWFFHAPYLSIFILVSLYLLTTAWSIVPIFTLYRGCELLVWVGLSIYFFTRLESLFAVVIFLAVYCTTWFCLNVPVLIESLSQNIFFSAIKDNFLPAVGFSVAVLGWTTRFRYLFCITGILTFVLAGSAAAVPCAVAACFAGLAFSRNIIIKLVGYIGALATLSFMIVYLLIPTQFPEIIELLSNILQKSTEELLNATGRYTIWSIIWDATKDRYFGSGFGSDRFIQLLSNMAEVNVRFGAPSVFIMSAHDAVLSAWTAAGWLGVVAMFFVYVAGIRYCSHYGGNHCVATTMILIFIILNSLTVPGLGGFFSPIWFIWIAVHSIAAAENRLKEKAPAKALPSGRSPTLGNGRGRATAV